MNIQEIVKIDPDIPVLLCTGFSDILSKKEAAAMGIKDIVLKPVVMSDLSRKIRQILDEV